MYLELTNVDVPHSIGQNEIADIGLSVIHRIKTKHSERDYKCAYNYIFIYFLHKD